MPAKGTTPTGSGRGSPAWQQAAGAAPHKTNLEIALDLADYWRDRCIKLDEQNVLLRREVAEAVNRLRVWILEHEEDSSE